MRAGAEDVSAVLADVARFGPFFTVATDPAESADPTWRPMRELYTDPRPVRTRIEHVRRLLGGDERVAASIAFQGWAAVVVSAPLAAVVEHGMAPDLDADALHWRPSASGPWPLWPAPRPASGSRGWRRPPTRSPTACSTTTSSR